MAHQPTNHEDSPLLHEDSPLLHDDSSAPGNTETTRNADDKMDTRLVLKIAAAMYSFTTLGLFNSSLGTVLPLLSSYYHLTDLQVSFIFLVSPIGYVVAAQCSDTVHHRFGQRGIAVAAPLLQILATTTVATHPGFGWVLVAFMFQGLGMGLLDGSWCAWAGSMERANTVSGLLHGSYSVGGAMGPFIVTVLTTKHFPWWNWYAILAGACALSFLVLVTAFRNETASVYRESKQSKTNDPKIDAKAVFKYRATWFCAAYFLTYVGIETAISGWIVSFMLRSRHATTYVAGLSSSGYWIGMAVGRLSLGFATDKMGVRRANGLYFLVALAIDISFAVSSSPVASVALMTMLGFIMGPMFPSGVVVLTRLLPAELHVAAVSFVASLGQIGAAFSPFVIGAVIDGIGIGVFRFAIVVETTLALLVWVAFTRLRPAVQAVSTARHDD